MLKLPTEELLEKRLPEAGLNLGDRIYGEEQLTEAKMDSVINGHSLEKLAKMREGQVAIERSGDGDASEKMYEYLCSIMTDAQKNIIINYPHYNFAFFHRIGDSKEFEKPFVNYTVLPAEELKSQMGREPRHMFNADRIIADKDRLLEEESISVNTMAGVFCIGVIYPGRVFSESFLFDETRTGLSTDEALHVDRFFDEHLFCVDFFKELKIERAWIDNKYPKGDIRNVCMQFPEGWDKYKDEEERGIKILRRIHKKPYNPEAVVESVIELIKLTKQ